MNFELTQMPARTVKPRTHGLTMVMDKGLSMREAEDMLSVNASYVDIVKLGFKELVCGQTDDLVRAYAMPNSKVTFDLFWLSRGTANDQPMQVGNISGPGGCTNPKAP